MTRREQVEDRPAPNEAIERLKAGNNRYVAGESTRNHCDEKRRHETARQGQHPFATVIACSDSRVPVELLFDQGIGDIFVIRVAGNVCGVHQIGSVEYGVDHLATPLVVVLGHTHCGAVTAAVAEAELHGSIPKLIDHVRPAVARAKSDNLDLPTEELVPAAIQANVWQSIEDLLKLSPSVVRRVKDGKLKVVGAIYDIEDGSVDWIGIHPEQDRLLT